MSWQTTKTAHLYKDTESGRYYSRLYRDGKEHWKSLKTTVYSVAVARLAQEQKTHREAVKVFSTVESGKATVGDVAKMYLDAEKNRVDIKPSMKHYRGQCVAAILKTVDFKDSAPQKVTEAQCKTWAARVAAQYSPTRYNNIVDTLRQIFALAIKQGQAFHNPAAELRKRKPSKKRLELPTSDQFAQLVKEIRSSGAWCQRQTGDLVEFLAYSGCRIDEARNVKWSDVQADGIWIHGHSETGTKGGDSRKIPILSAMRRLLGDLEASPRESRQDDRKGFVLAITECREALETACEKVGIKKMTHHDLRHLFCTRAISSGVDVPTVAQWSGHKDGGALLMRTNSHLLDDHSQRMAAQVTF